MSIAVKNGIFLGVALLLGTLVYSFVSPSGYLQYSSFVFFIIAVIIMYKNGTDERTANGGFISFGQVFTSILICVAIAYLFKLVGNYVAYNFVSPQLADIQMEKSIEAIEQMRGMLGDEVADKSLDEIEKQDLGSPFQMIIQYFTVLFLNGVIVNLIISAIVHKKKPMFDNQQA